MTAKHIEERDARASSSNATQAAESSGSAVKPFTHWIRDAPKEKWSLLYDTDGSRYGMMTTNITESGGLSPKQRRQAPCQPALRAALPAILQISPCRPFNGRQDPWATGPLSPVERATGWYFCNFFKP